VPPVRKIVSPFWIRPRAALAIRCFSSRLASERSVKGISAPGEPGASTLPATRRTAPACCRSCRSRRRVDPLIPRRSARSLIGMGPPPCMALCTSRSRSILRSACLSIEGVCVLIAD